VAAGSRAGVCICWDLDNTLVDSGTLLRSGLTLEEAIVEAYPVPNMLAFYCAIYTALPDAEHFILSARPESMKSDTLAWFRQHGLRAPESHVCLVPEARAKPRIWRELARSARLVIVDDLSFNHEADQPSVYQDLLDTASQLAAAYVGLPQIARIASNLYEVDSVTQQTLHALHAN
jgi:hypothetical protein